MRNKSWPLWEEWKEIFGKDRAVGARSRGAAESVAMMKATQEQTNGNVDGDYYPSLDGIFPDEVVANEVVGEHAIPDPGNSSNTQGDRSAQKPVKKQGKKRKSIDQLDCVLDIMTKMNDNTTTRLETLSKRIGYEFEQSAKREEVYKLLGQISGLTMKQKFYTSAKLVKEPELLDLFRSMPEDDRPDFVVFMLESDNMI